MAQAIAVDTHAVVWYLTGAKELSATAQEAIESAIHEGKEIYVSAISLIELVYLTERGRVPHADLSAVVGALQDSASPFTLAPIDMRVVVALAGVSRDQVPEMPDRIIAATATALGVPLVTADSELRAAAIKTIW